MYTIVAIIDVEPKIRDELLVLTLESARGAHNEPGCHRFDIVQPQDNPNGIGAYDV